MTNVLSPKGFQSSSTTPGREPNFGLNTGKMAYNASACYRGDAVILSSGKVAVATATGNTGAAVLGVAEQFSWVSTAQQRRVWQSFYPGSDSIGNADVDVWFTNDAAAEFEVQCNAGPAVQADIGSFFNFATAAGNTYSGLSGWSLDYSTKNATQGVLPFVLRAILIAPKTDPLTQYNLVRVGFATQTNF